MATLYRDYRPQNFSEVLGQQHVKITLQNEISAGKIAQAFLFCGPRAVGKTTLARVLAKAVNCLERQEGQYEPCGRCANCFSITTGSNLDVIEIDAASNTGVDNVRDNIISFSRLVPSKNKYKIFIIDEVHMLSPSAFNALLKIIEEPPSYVMFILCTTEIHKVPATIISRCERFDFRRIGITEVVGKLKRIARAEKIEIDDEVLEAVARQSGGHLRDAESLLGQVFSLGDKRITLEQAELVIPHYNNNEAVEFIDALGRKDAAKAISLANSLVDSGVNIRNFTAEIINLVRKMLITKVSPELSDSLGLNLGDALEIKVNTINQRLGLDNLTLFLRRLLAAYNDKNQLISQLPLELAVIEICSGLVLAPVSEQKPGQPLAAGNRNYDTSLKNQNSSPLAPLVKSMLVQEKTELVQVNEINAQTAEAADPVLDGGLNLSRAEVLERWPEFLVKIKKHNHSLSFVLQNCEPQTIKTSCLQMAFKYKFHYDRINDAGIKALIEKTLAEVFGIRISVMAKLDENLELRRHQQSGSDLKSASAITAASAAVLPESPVNSSAAAMPNQSLNTNASAQSKENSGLMDNLLKSFGGEVIG